ncbi:MAG: hypothetical protein JST04_03790 [Bdellovibrionales bacterium]|nr:hypothetical protein [Bdellovibrionales bacterium]
MGTTKKFSGIFPVIAFAIALGALAPSAFAASGGATFFSTAPETTPVHNAVQLNQLFQKGVGPYNSSMDGKLYPYPLPRNGQFGAPLYNGCYDRKGTRLHDLDADLSCTTTIQQNPGRAIFRLFLGYKISCSGGVTGSPSVCSSAQLLMNCEYKQVQIGTGSLESTSAATRYCSNESGILRNAQGSSQNNNAMNGCSPGEDGLTYSTTAPCTKCAAGTFNPNFNPNNVACTTCASVAPSPLPSGIASIGGWTSTVGSTSAADCHPTGITCSAGYHVSTDTYSCEPNGACPIILNLTPKNPSATVSPNPQSNDGQITANASGASGTPSILITSPVNKAPSNSTLPAIFDGLSANTYTVTASDNTCSTSAQITLFESASTPSCSSCPSGSTLSGTNCVTSPTTSSSYVQYGYRCQGAGGCTSQPCYPTCSQGMTFGQVSSSDSTPRTCDGNSLYTTFGGSCSMQSGPTTIPGTQSCPSGFSLIAGTCSMACTPPTASPTPSPTAGCPYSPPMSMIGTGTASGDISASITGNVGTLTSIHWMYPASGSCTVGGTNGNALSCNGVAAGTYTIQATDPANTQCKASTSVTVGAAAPLCDIYGTIASSGTPVTCNYTCTGPQYPVVTRQITSGTCGGKYNSGMNYCTGTSTSHPECSNEVWAESELGCTTGAKPAGAYHTQPPGTYQGQILGPSEASTCTIGGSCAVTGTITGHTDPSSSSATDGSITVQITGTQQSPQLKDNGTAVGSPLPSGSTPQSSTITGLGVGSHAITVVQQAGYGCSSNVGTLTLSSGCSTATPTNSEISNTDTGPGGTRTQVFQIGTNITSGDQFEVGVYSYMVWVTATSSDTPSSIAIKLRDAVNNTTAAQWNYYSVAPASGTPGFKPTATASGNLLTLTLNYQNQFAGGARRGCDPGGYSNPPPYTPPAIPNCSDTAYASACPAGTTLQFFYTTGELVSAYSAVGSGWSSASPAETCYGSGGASPSDHLHHADCFPSSFNPGTATFNGMPLQSCSSGSYFMGSVWSDGSKICGY